MWNEKCKCHWGYEMFQKREDESIVIYFSAKPSVYLKMFFQPSQCGGQCQVQCAYVTSEQLRMS